mgnify:CR=1 FL=1
MEKYVEILTERFSKDSLMALATVDEKGKSWVRTIDAIFYQDSFYTITYGLSNKMQQIEKNPTVAISGEWFSGHGIGENLGHIKLEQNSEIADKLRKAFSAWSKPALPFSATIFVLEVIVSLVRLLLAFTTITWLFVR